MSMQSILAASQSLSQMQTMQSVRARTQGAVNVLRVESRQDGGNEQKDAKADALEEKSNMLLDNLMSESAKVNEVLKPEEDEKTETDEKAEETARQPKTDTLELSDSATKYSDRASRVKAAVGEAVTYHADGSKAPNASVKSTPTFKATA